MPLTLLPSAKHTIVQGERGMEYVRKGLDGLRRAPRRAGLRMKLTTTRLGMVRAPGVCRLRNTRRNNAPCRNETLRDVRAILECSPDALERLRLRIDSVPAPRVRSQGHKLRAPILQPPTVRATSPSRSMPRASGHATAPSVWRSGRAYRSSISPIVAEECSARTRRSHSPRPRSS